MGDVASKDIECPRCQAVSLTLHSHGDPDDQAYIKAHQAEGFIVYSGNTLVKVEMLCLLCRCRFDMMFSDLSTVIKDQQ